MIKDWKKEILTIPNLLSLFRLVLIPVYVVIYLNARDSADYYLAAGILAVYAALISAFWRSLCSRHAMLIFTRS